MKIALIAMSGIRAENPELMKLGLKLPGIFERAKILFAMPSLSLLTLAGMVPDDVEIEYREYREFPSTSLRSVTWRRSHPLRPQLRMPIGLRTSTAPGAQKWFWGACTLPAYPRKRPNMLTRLPQERVRYCGLGFSAIFGEAACSPDTNAAATPDSTSLIPLCRATTC